MKNVSAKICSAKHLFGEKCFAENSANNLSAKNVSASFLFGKNVFAERCVRDFLSAKKKSPENVDPENRVMRNQDPLIKKTVSVMAIRQLCPD